MGAERRRAGEGDDGCARLSVRQLAGQLVVARYPGRSASSAAAALAKLHLGGVILEENVPTDVVTGLRSSAARVQAAMAADGRDWPAIIAVDQEGGPIARVHAPATAFTAAMALGASTDAVCRCGWVRRPATSCGRSASRWSSLRTPT